MALVSNQPLREAFERSGETPTAIASRLANGRKWPSKETSEVKRRLGLMPHTHGNGKRYTHTRMRESTALAYAEALGLDPHEIGL